MRHRMRTPPTARSGLIIAALLGMIPVGAMAQSVERNPFLPPPPETRIEAAEQDRVLRITQDVVRGEMGRLERTVTETVERRLMDRLDRDLASLGDDIRGDVDSRIGAFEATAATLKTEIPEMIRAEIEERTKNAGGAALGELPEGTTFVACVNGKALYRDQNGSTFYSNEDDLAEAAAGCSS